MLKFLIIVLGIYLFFKLFGRTILNAVAKLIYNKAYSNINKYQESQSSKQNKPEGEVTIQKVKDNTQQGDFVDYEEVK